MRVTVSVNVIANHHVWYLALFHWDGGITEWAYRDLNILLECKRTLMCSVCKMVFTEILFTRITFYWKKI